MYNVSPSKDRYFGYRVQPNDTLSGIAQKYLGSAHRWTEIARLNRIVDSHRLVIGRLLFLPEADSPQSFNQSMKPWRIASNGGKAIHERHASIIPARTLFFTVIDEPNPFTRRVVRKVMIPPPNVTDRAEIARLVSPQKYGFSSKKPGSPLPPGRHIAGDTKSNLISASERWRGSDRFSGKRFWINVGKAKAGGARMLESSEIIPDLDRVIAKTRDPSRVQKLKEIRKFSIEDDMEVLFEGHIPAAAIDTGLMMGIKTGLHLFRGVGIVTTAYDLKSAGERSLEQHSIKPLEAETVRQVGGWEGAIAGAELFGSIGGMAGIEAGPGALVTAFIGGAIGAYAGFTGVGPLAKFIEEH